MHALLTQRTFCKESRTSGNFELPVKENHKQIMTTFSNSLNPSRRQMPKVDPENLHTQEGAHLHTYNESYGLASNCSQITSNGCSGLSIRSEKTQKQPIFSSQTQYGITSLFIEVSAEDLLKRRTLRRKQSPLGPNNHRREPGVYHKSSITQHCHVCFIAGHTKISIASKPLLAVKLIQ